MSIEETFGRYAGAITVQGYGYLLALAATLIFAMVWRMAWAPRRPAVAEPISATELAFLRSEIAPVVTALAGLRAGGRITESGLVDRAVRTRETDPFTERVLKRVAADSGHTVLGLYADSRGDLAALESHLSGRGLVRTRGRRALMRWGTAPSITVMLAGIGYALYLLTTFSEQPIHTVTFTAVAVATALYVTIALPGLLRVNRLTRAGRRLLAAQQEGLAYLEPARRPAFETYGPAAVAMSVALFGTGALWALDAGYSSSVELAGSSAAAGGGGSGSTCGGSSCGDGGGGGGCGGCGGCGG